MPRAQTIQNVKILNRDALKYIAIFVMLIGHLIAWGTLIEHPDHDNALYDLPTGLMILSSLSVFCPPVMFSFIADGYKYTRDRKKYALRLFLFACITQPFDWLIFQPIHGWRTCNVIFTLFFGLLAIMVWESGCKLWQRIMLVILCDAATVLISSDWLVFGVLHIIFLHIFREKPRARLISYTFLMLGNFLLNLTLLGKIPMGKLLIHIAAMIAAFMAAYFCMTTFYNGKKGKHPFFTKWFFYAFYPLHYLIIWCIVAAVRPFIS